jgi:dTDP-4-dehydrorhamnose reductase
MSILIFGNGHIANLHLEHFRERGVRSAVAAGVDITDAEAVREAVRRHRPDVVINTAGRTSLEWCGGHRLEAFHTNVLGAATVAKVCDQAGSYLIQYSTACLYDSADGQARKEDDLPQPASYYGWTKLWAEQLVGSERSPDFRCLVLRLRQPVSAEVHHRNMLVKMLTFANFVDTANSGTVLADMLEWIDGLLAAQATGVYHLANTGFTTPYRIGLMLREYVLPGLPVHRISKEQLDAVTPNRRVDTLLDVGRLQAHGIKVLPYEQRVEDTIRELARRIAKSDRQQLRTQLEITATASRERTHLNDVYPTLYA